MNEVAVDHDATRPSIVSVAYGGSADFRSIGTSIGTPQFAHLYVPPRSGIGRPHDE